MFERYLNTLLVLLQTISNCNVGPNPSFLTSSHTGSISPSLLPSLLYYFHQIDMLFFPSSSCFFPPAQIQIPQHFPLPWSSLHPYPVNFPHYHHLHPLVPPLLTSLSQGSCTVAGASSSPPVWCPLLSFPHPVVSPSFTGTQGAPSL